MAATNLAGSATPAHGLDASCAIREPISVVPGLQIGVVGGRYFASRRAR
jgi:hypothetical protein